MNLVVVGNNTLTLTSPNPTGGTVSVLGATTLKDGGTLPNAAAVNVNYATFTIDNTGLYNINGRMNSTAPVTSTAPLSPTTAALRRIPRKPSDRSPSGPVFPSSALPLLGQARQT